MAEKNTAPQRRYQRGEEYRRIIYRKPLYGPSIPISPNGNCNKGISGNAAGLPEIPLRIFDTINAPRRG
jgi:hypothetical protein